MIFAVAGENTVTVDNRIEQEINFFIHRRGKGDARDQEHASHNSANSYSWDIHQGHSTICAAVISTGQLDPFVYGPIPVLALTDLPGGICTEIELSRRCVLSES